MDDLFRFRQFRLHNSRSAMKVGTDAVLLGAAMTLLPSDRCLLDVGAGTGVIAMLAACRMAELVPELDSEPILRTGTEPNAGTSPESNRGSWFIKAIDIDGDSVAEAALNFAESPWKNHLDAECAALQKYAPKEPLDCIFSNPPFFDASLVNPSERESNARHTITLSYRDLCGFAQTHLSPSGRLSAILPSDCELQLRRTAVSYSLYPFRIIRIRTTERKKVSRIIAEFCRTVNPPLVEEEILVKDNIYTNKFYL